MGETTKIIEQRELLMQKGHDNTRNNCRKSLALPHPSTPIIHMAPARTPRVLTLIFPARNRSCMGHIILMVKLATSVSRQLITRTSPISAAAVSALKGGKGLATKAEAG